MFGNLLVNHCPSHNQLFINISHNSNRYINHTNRLITFETTIIQKFKLPQLDPQLMRFNQHVLNARIKMEAVELTLVQYCMEPIRVGSFPP